MLFICPASKKLFLGRNNIEGALAPVHPTSYTYDVAESHRSKLWHSMSYSSE